MIQAMLFLPSVIALFAFRGQFGYLPAHSCMDVLVMFHLFLLLFAYASNNKGLKYIRFSFSFSKNRDSC